MENVENLNNDAAPEVPGEQEEGVQGSVGSLTQQEMQVLNTLRQHGNQVAMEIGNLEIRKGRLLGTIANLEMQTQSILTEAGKRLGIPEGQPWHVNPDGSVRLAEQG